MKRNGLKINFGIVINARNKFEKGIFGQKCVGCIVATYNQNIIACIIIHRFPLFKQYHQIENYSLNNTVMDIDYQQIINSSHIDTKTKQIIQLKIHIFILIFTLLQFRQHYEYIAANMFRTLFKTYPNELFVSSVLYENIQIWENHNFIPFQQQIVERHWRRQNHNLAQIYRIFKLTSNSS